MTKQNSPLVLGTEPIGKLLTQYAIPAIIAMTASSLYNMADSIFIGHGVGALAISGLALTFPLMSLAAAFGSLVGVGASTLVAVKLGQKDYEGANNVLGNVLILNVVLGVAFTIAFLFLLDPVLYFFGASENTISYARDYMRIILYGNVVTHMYLGLNAVLRSSGFPKMAMYATLASVVINCALNPLFIFGFGWGIKGSAWATVISQVISLTGQLIHFSRPKRLLHFKKGIYRLRSEIVDKIEAVGMLESIPLWIVTLLGSLLITVLSFVMILTVYGRMFKLYMYTAIAPIPLATFAGEPTQSVGKNFIRSYAGVCLEGAIIALACIIFSVFASSPPAIGDTSLSAVTIVWNYVGELVFNLLVLVGAVKASDRIVKEIMGL